jgi:mxaK protein
MSTRTLPRSARWSIAAALLLLALLAFETWRLQQQQGVNARVLAENPQTLSATDALEVLHAEALRLGHAGKAREAHELYARVAMHGSRELRLRAEYNHANLLLREALALRGDSETDDGRSLPVLELAKESYRKVLREAPEIWDARYNLERALRLAPEPPEVEEGAGPAPRQRERAPTTMRGETLGLP